MKVPGWTTGTVAVNAGTLNLVGATFANGAAGTPVSIGGIEYADGLRWRPRRAGVSC